MVQTMNERHSHELLKKTFSLKTSDSPDYRGDNTAQEYDKFIAGHWLSRGDKAFSSKQAIFNSDRQAYAALRSADHAPHRIEQTIAARSLNTLERSKAEQTLYGRSIGRSIEGQPQAAALVARNQRLREQQGFGDDRRVETTEIATRKADIEKQTNVWEPEKLKSTVSEAEIYRSNAQVRARVFPHESPQSADVQLAKTHLDGKAENMGRTAKIIASHSPEAAGHLDPAQQEAYGRRIAARAYREQMQDYRLPEGDLSNKAGYVTSSRCYREAQRHSQGRQNTPMREQGRGR